MTDAAPVKASAIPPHAQIVQMSMAHMVSSIVYVAARLNLADLLASGPRTSEDLAKVTNTDPRSLYRVMRTMASLGLFVEETGHRFSLTALGEALKEGAPGSARATILTLAGPVFARPFDDLLYSVETGNPAFDKLYGMRPFDWLTQHPEEAALFNETMIGFHGMEPPAVAAAYDFSVLGTLADVGGSTGNGLTTIVGKYPNLRGILFDLPHVVRGASTLIQERGLADRIRIEEGSFFDTVPTGADAYFLSHVIHDWPEEECLKILANCRRAMKPEGRLLIVEMVLPPGGVPHPGKMLDMIMLSLAGGQERTEAEYHELLGKAGFRVARVVPTESPVSVVEAFPS